MKKFILFFTLLIPLIGLAQSHASTNLKFNVKYEDESGTYAYVFKSNGTGSWIMSEESYDGSLSEFTQKLTWKKKSSNEITVSRNPGDGIVSYVIKIVNSNTLKVNTYGDKWEEFKVKK
ncbi:MAG: hypothetical protein K2M93_08245 [Muribaculaceae bacterium]|nr:hypothetical protein [Muribaculaceae bacterium]